MTDTIRIKGVYVDREAYQPLRELHMLKADMDDWVDRLEGDTWGWNNWYDLMCELLQYGTVSDKAGKTWPDTVTWDAEELRDLITRIQHCMFDAVHNVYLPMVQGHLEPLIEDTEKSLGIPTDNEYLWEDLDPDGYAAWKAKQVGGEEE